MFKKLLGNLPFNPSLITEVSFYAKRMKRESAVRRTGLILLALTMIIQFFAVVSPAQPSLATSNNDLINGGIVSRDQAVAHCQNGAEDYGRILANYSITCANVASAATISLRSTDNNKQLFSMGRLPYGKTGEQPVNIAGTNNGLPLYLRYLWAWDTHNFSTYKALSGTSSKGLRFFILFNCGNLVFVGIPPVTPPPPPPVIPPPPPPPPVIPPQELSCTNLVMNISDNSQVQLGTQLIVRGQASGKNIKPGQKVDMYYDYLSATTNKVVASSQALGVSFNGTTADDSQNHTFVTDSPGQYVIRLVVKYDSTKVAAGSATGNCVKSITVQQACTASQSSQDISACLVSHKKAKNTTQNLADANGTTAKPSDTIEYTLSVTNSGNITVPKFPIQENISDLLDYADVTDLHGGSQDSNNIVSWPALDIKSKQTVTKLITIKIKATIPSTPVSSSDGGHFDCKITNVYGDVVVINMQCPVAKTVETTTTLPNTGPGASLAIGFGLTAIVAYFFARSKLFATELDLVKEEFSSAGGQ